MYSILSKNEKKSSKIASFLFESGYNGQCIRGDEIKLHSFFIYWLSCMNGSEHI